MAVQPVDLTGGESVYCINQAQLERAFQFGPTQTPTAARGSARPWKGWNRTCPATSAPRSPSSSSTGC